jgi:hypothetical protein
MRLAATGVKTARGNCDPHRRVFNARTTGSDFGCNLTGPTSRVSGPSWRLELQAAGRRHRTGEMKGRERRGDEESRELACSPWSVVVQAPTTASSNPAGIVQRVKILWEVP